MRSMTAFARASKTLPNGGLVWEIKSVNHRFLEVFVRMPEEVRHVEMMVRERLREKLSRGKVEATLKLQLLPNADSALLDKDRLGQVANLLVQIQQSVPGTAPIDPMSILAWPGVVQNSSGDGDELEQAIVAACDEAIDALNAARDREGAALAEIMRQRAEAALKLVENLQRMAPEIIRRHIDSLRVRVRDLAGELDEGRWSQEVVLLAQRSDVTEEIDRLSTHLKEIFTILTKHEPIGRRLDFLMQELNREANTLGAKACTMDITQVSLALKVLIEQMREQIQNLE
ncbi:MAG: YicC family protein [Gammaproteobacteria bacterium]|nr:YicC family protein [Gammaproteobacteria bacterium]